MRTWIERNMFIRNVIWVSLLSITTTHQLSCPCAFGQFVIQNCFKLPNGMVRGVSCEVCQSCKGEGQVIVQGCTRLSDTVCGCEDGYLALNSTHCEREVAGNPTSTAGSIPNPSDNHTPETITPLVLAAVLLFVLVVLIVLCRGIFRQRSYKKEKNKECLMTFTSEASVAQEV